MILLIAFPCSTVYCGYFIQKNMHDNRSNAEADMSVQICLPVCQELQTFEKI